MTIRVSTYLEMRTRISSYFTDPLTAKCQIFPKLVEGLTSVRFISPRGTTFRNTAVNRHSCVPLRSRRSYFSSILYSLVLVSSWWRRWIRWIVWGNSGSWLAAGCKSIPDNLAPSNNCFTVICRSLFAVAPAVSVAGQLLYSFIFLFLSFILFKKIN